MLDFLYLVSHRRGCPYYVNYLHILKVPSMFKLVQNVGKVHILSWPLRYICVVIACVFLEILVFVMKVIIAKYFS